MVCHTPDIGAELPNSFPKEALTQAASLAEDHKDLLNLDSDRLDLTHLVTYTIDDDDAFEIDDAISLQTIGNQQWIWIHIADPSRYIGIDTPLDLEARKRAISVYLTDKVISIYPEVIAKSVLSLNAGRKCPAMSAGVHLDESGEVIKYRIERTFIKPKYRLTYKDADELIDFAPTEEIDLAVLSKLLKVRLNWRLSQSAIQLEQPIGRFRAKNNKLTVEILEPSVARSLVSEAMILYGTVVAQHCIANQLTVPFRSQSRFELPPNSSLINLPEGPVRNTTIRTNMTKGISGIKPSPHFSMGLDAYVQATSPIRRYSDLIIQRQIISFSTGRPQYSDEDILSLIDELSAASKQSLAITREDQYYSRYLWFKNSSANHYSAQFLRWLRPNEGIALVHITSLAMDLPSKIKGVRDLPPGSLLKIRVDSIDDKTFKIYLVNE
ncbi:ribonuclease catalytic domain-containing protein [Prochlorococcus sp. MIT 1300]|uniref:ribonuclease catalytic domain-containing protein n=1 Tax=Prochlorococcus sp. MIT 1300 TaxID=3096218 RepID=UPI002A766195|nr:RNB domain-containing ribonuclease [Prochlorococcus sp. MIT 1300]